MTHIAEQPLDDFTMVLDKSKSLLSLISSMKDFGSLTIEDVLSKNKEEIDTFQDSIRNNNINLLILSGTLLLYTVGQFENYVKETLKIVGEEYSHKSHNFDYLPLSMQKHLINQTAEIVQKPTKYGYQNSDVRNLIQQLATSLTASGSVPINKESLVVTEQNMRPEVLSDILRRLDIKDIWKEISKQTSVKSFFGNENETEVEKSLKEELNTIMEDRNKIAHPSSSPVFPDIVAFSRYLSFFEVFSKEFTSIMISKCKVYSPVVNATF